MDFHFPGSILGKSAISACVVSLPCTFSHVVTQQYKDPVFLWLSDSCTHGLRVVVRVWARGEENRASVVHYCLGVSTGNRKKLLCTKKCFGTLNRCKGVCWVVLTLKWELEHSRSTPHLKAWELSRFSISDFKNGERNKNLICPAGRLWKLRSILSAPGLALGH